VKIALTDLAARFGSNGPVQGAHIEQAGPSGRALSVSVDGAAGPKVVDGHQFSSGLGLKSTLFTLHIEEADVAPPAPAPADLIQVPPDQLAPAAPVAPVPDLAAAQTGPVKLVLPGTGKGNDRLRWIGLAVLLLPAWALAATRFGYPVIPDQMTRWLASRFKPAS
jgi:hypothetical protein